MTAIFLPSPLDAPELLAAVLGTAGPAPRAAVLPRHRVWRGADGIRIALVPAPDSTASGSLLDPRPSDRARLDFAMAVLGAGPARATGPHGEVGIYRFSQDAVPPDGEAVEDSTPEADARLRETLYEVMGHYGQRAADDVTGLLHGIAIRALARSRGPVTSTPVELGAGLGAGDVAAVERTFSYARFFAMEEHRLRHRRFDGAISDTLDRAVFTSGDAVTVLPFDPRTRSVLLIEQFRAGPHARRDPRPWCLETVAGRCDRLEAPEVTARREALEEAGLNLGRLERIAGFYPSPAIMAEYLVSFVGEADLSDAGGTHGLAEEHEDIRALVVPLDRALASVASGEINTAPLMISLLWLDRHAERLSEAWR